MADGIVVMVGLGELFQPERVAEIAQCGLRSAAGDGAIEEWKARCDELARENPSVPLIDIMLAAGLDVEQERFGTE